MPNRSDRAALRSHQFKRLQQLVSSAVVNFRRCLLIEEILSLISVPRVALDARWHPCRPSVVLNMAQERGPAGQRAAGSGSRWLPLGDFAKENATGDRI